MAKYSLPPALENKCDAGVYRRWLDRAATRHYRRDRRRGNISSSRREYKEAIHAAVCDGGDHDAYTGKPLRWDLISTYDNEKARQEGRAYKKEFGDLPTVDHVGDGTREADFQICSWRVNDCKSDLDLDEFLALCEDVLSFHRTANKGLVT